MRKHPTAIVAPGATLGENVDVGPYSIIEEDVTVGDNCRIGPRVHLLGDTTIGSGCSIHTGAVIGDEPQDYHYDDGEPSSTAIGRNCTIREYVTVHRGSASGTRTQVGDNAMLMAFAHIGHNCIIEDNVVVANASLIAGHVEIGARAFISGAIKVHQFVRIGTMAMIGGDNVILQDVPPYTLVQFRRVQGANVVGLKRAGLAPGARDAIRSAIKIYYFAGLNRPSALERIRSEYGDVTEVEHFASFIEGSKRGIVSGRSMGRGAQ